MRTTLLSFTLAISVFVISIAHAVTPRAIVAIDCDHSSIKNEGTKNNINIEFWNNNTRLGSSNKNSANAQGGLIVWQTFLNFFGAKGSDIWVEGSPQCNSTYNTSYVAHVHDWPDTLKDIKPTHFVIRTTGDDAFFMDYVLFKWENMPGYELLKKQQFGADGANGFCLSTDPNDAKGEWKDRVTGCYKAIRFDIESGKAFVEN